MALFLGLLLLFVWTGSAIWTLLIFFGGLFVIWLVVEAAHWPVRR